jgi:hypothetical protein
MRKSILGGICGVLMGTLMLHTGHNFLTWEFWAGMGLMVAYGMNCGA